MRIRFIQEIINSFKVKISDMCTTKDTVRLIYFKNAKHKNAGDIFNESIMKYFNLKFKKALVTNADLACIGSILDSFLVDDKAKFEDKYDECIIVGSGFIKPNESKQKLRRKVNIKALRGKKSVERFMNAAVELDNIVLADPGILASYIFPINCEKKYDVGIIPHYVDKENSCLINNIHLKDNKYIIIDIEQDVEEVLKQLCECNCIISSSLHGLIFADSYNIPNRQMVVSDLVIGGTYKFEDYYSAYDLDLPEVIDIRKCVISDAIIARVKSEYIDKEALIKSKQIELVNIFEDISNKINNKV